MIGKIHLKFGANQEQPSLSLDVTPTPITIFVGPNNSGKSQVLIEIENYCRGIGTNGRPNNNLVLSRLEVIPYGKEEIEQEIAKIEQTPGPNEILIPGHVTLGKLKASKELRFVAIRECLINEAQNPNREGQAHSYFWQFLDMHIIRLDGANRLNLLKAIPAGDLQRPVNILAHLFVNDRLRAEVRRIIYDAFSKYFVIDPTNMGNLRVRLSNREPASEQEERGLSREAIDFHRNAELISNAGDGVKAFAGIIATILAGDPKVTLIDEPEAFLHPALSEKLGKELAGALKGSRKNLFVSTHSSSFLMGCIQSGASLNIVRLTYNYAEPTARVLSQDEILPLMRDPLLRSTGVLNGLFYESVIVTEADADRVFYKEINERLLAANDPRGIRNCLFVNAQNKQTVWKIVEPLRKLGIPVLGIVDIDVLKEGGQVWTKLLEGAFMPQTSYGALQIQRKDIYDAMKKTGKNMKCDGGIEILDGQDKEACENLFWQLAEYGVMIVPGGELESWLPNLGITGHRSSSKWLIDAFEKMGSDPDAPNYLTPSGGDVWEFMGLSKKWLSNGARRGIPVQ